MLSLCEKIQQASRKRKPATAGSTLPTKKKKSAPAPKETIPAGGEDSIGESGAPPPSQSAPCTPEINEKASKKITLDQFFHADEPVDDLNISVKELSMVDSDLEEIQKLNSKAKDFVEL